MTNLELLYPSLARFSDIDWAAVTKEYEETSIEISFPEYLQLKAEEGDCPPYLFELAYYEMALMSARLSEGPFPHETGVYLNPTAHFLSLQFDVPKMIGLQKPEILEKEQILCLYRDRSDRVHNLELSEEQLLLLQELENGPKRDQSFVEDQQRASFEALVEHGLILVNT